MPKQVQIEKKEENAQRKRPRSKLILSKMALLREGPFFYREENVSGTQASLRAKRRDLAQKVKTLRDLGQIPACLFEKGKETLPICVSRQMLEKCLSKSSRKLKLDIENEGTFLVSLEEIQRRPLGQGIQHISFKSINTKEKTALKVGLQLKGKAKAGVVNQLLKEVSIKGHAHELPDVLDVDISSLGLGEVLYVKDIVAQGAFEFASEDLNRPIVNCQHEKVEKTEEPSSAESSAAPPETESPPEASKDAGEAA